MEIPFADLPCRYLAFLHIEHILLTREERQQWQQPLTWLPLWNQRMFYFNLLFCFKCIFFLFLENIDFALHVLQTLLPVYREILCYSGVP